MSFIDYKPKSAMEHRFGNKTRKAGDVWYGGYTPSSGGKKDSRSSGPPVMDELSETELNLLNNNGNNKEPAVMNNAVTYDEDKYRYYFSDFGTGTGAEAYSKDMENYNAYAQKHADTPALGLITQMMHPDWGRSQRPGGVSPIEEQDYSTKPQHRAGTKAHALFERRFGNGSSDSAENKNKFGSAKYGNQFDTKWTNQRQKGYGR